MKKPFIRFAVIAAVAISVLVICAVVFEPQPILDTVLVEIGSEKIIAEQFIKEGKTAQLVSDLSQIPLDKLGVYRVEFSYKKKAYYSTLKIVDTTAPTGTPVSQTIYSDETLSPENFITDIIDATETKVEFDKTPDFTKAGEQNVVIRLTDKSGNIGRITAKLTVLTDTTAPVFSGLEKLSVNLGQTVSYRKNVTATDDRDGNLSFTIDASAVNLEKEGTYVIVYEATDKSGNTARVEREIFVSSKLVINEELVNEKAQEILDKILKDGMSVHEKIYTIFWYVRRNIAYSGSHENVFLSAAYYAMVHKKGDCYNYFAMAKVLLDMIGVDNIPVERYMSKSSHYWLLVNIGTGWYHYDASPQSLADPYSCFMKTNEQVQDYANGRSDGRSDYYNIDESKYPELATEEYKAPQ